MPTHQDGCFTAFAILIPRRQVEVDEEYTHTLFRIQTLQRVFTFFKAQTKLWVIHYGTGLVHDLVTTWEGW